MAQRITFDKLTANGNGLGYWHDKALFAPGPLPGEVAWIKIVIEHPKYSEGIVKRLPEKVVDRSETAEKHYLTCSPWQNLRYDYQLELKEQMLAETFAKADVVVAPKIVAAPHVAGYRNKLTFKLINDEDGKLQLAMHERGNDLEYVATPDGCVLGSPAMNAAAISVRDTLPAKFVSPKMNLVVRESRSSGEISIVLSENGKVVWSNDVHELTERIGSLDLRYSWRSFFQVNPAAFELALDAIKKLVPKGARVLDLYGGVGTIGLSLAAQATTVTGVELELAAVEAAERNALQNKIQNYSSVGAASEFVEAELLRAADTIIVDPPRAGLDRKLIDHLLAVGPERIVYLSCNPQTQARDLERLTTGYRTGTVTGFDFYPGTLHLESLVLLERPLTLTKTDPHAWSCDSDGALRPVRIVWR